MMTFIIALCFVAAILAAKILVDLICGYEEKESKHTYMDNDEFDYGHNVKHNEE